MSRLYRLWFRSTEVSLLAVVALLVLATHAHAGDPVEAAKKAAEGVLQQLGTEQGIQDRLVNPLVNKGAKLTTLDGKQSFAGQLQCASSGRFLQISLNSLAKDGDLTSVSVSQDVDLNETVDYTYALPVVSGICGNGVISCSPGTWSSCRYYQWTANSAGQLSLAEVGITALKGCYCINSSCKYETNTLTVLKALGDGAVDAVSARIPRVSITATQVTGKNISYSGQDTETCSTVETLDGSKKPEYYYSHTGKIEADAASEVINQKGDTDSPYSLIVNSLAWNQDALKDYYESCAIERKADIDLVETFCDEAAPSGQLGSAETNKMYKVLQNKVYQGQCGCAYTAVKYCPAPSAEKVGSPPPHGKFYGSGAENFTPAGKGGCNYDEVWLYNVCRRFSDVFKNKIVDHCAALQAQCVLKDEVVDSVQTYKDYNPTGKAPGQSCKTLTGHYGTYKVCKPWWLKQRVYHCEKEGDTLEFDRKRVEVVTSSAADSAGVMVYDDHRLVNGSWVDESHSSKLSAKEPYDGCEISCKVRTPSRDTQAGLSGHTGHFRSSVDGYDYFVKPCKENVCNLDAGEELVADCQCINDFVHAVTQMEVMKESGKNMKCDGNWDESGNCTGKISIFTGHEGACRTPGFETKWFDCCNSKPESWFIFKKFCTEDEKTTVQAMENKLVHYVGKRCVKDLPLVGCVQEEKVYCKFQGLLGRIIQDQGRPQLKAFGSAGGWGSGKAPQCRGLSPEELQRIDFSKINFSEFVDHIKTKAMGEIEKDMKDKVGDFYDGIQ